MAKTTKYFAGIKDDTVYFRASNGRVDFKSLTFSKEGRWQGFSGKPGGGSVIEIDRATYNILLRAKAVRIAEAFKAYRAEWDLECKAAEALGKKLPYFNGKGFGSSPTDSWCLVADLSESLVSRIGTSLAAA